MFNSVRVTEEEPTIVVGPAFSDQFPKQCVQCDALVFSEAEQEQHSCSFFARHPLTCQCSMHRPEAQ